MIRPSWTPASDEQRELAEKAVAAFASVGAAIEAANALEEAAWQALAAANAAGVPVTWLAARIERSRATIHRKLDRLDRADGQPPVPRS